MSSLLTTDLTALNDIFLGHQLHSLRLSDQRSFLDAMAGSEKTETFHPGDYLRFKGETYWVEEAEENSLLLRKGDKVVYKRPGDEGLEKIPGNRLLDLLEERLRQNYLDPKNVFDLRQKAFELSYSDSKKYASIKGSRIQILPHQISAVERVASSLHHRFLIADEVGLGKTVETGLIIKELSMRYRYRDILVVVPASLVLQWQTELREKFSEEFVILDKRSLEKAGDLDKFMRKNPRLLVSIDFARQETLGEPLARKIWDLVVFDEAHRLRRDRQKVTQAYAFAEKIALHSKSLLLLSATPFSGKIEELYFLLALLDRGKLGSLHSFVEEYLNRGGDFLSGLIRDVTIRRTKKQVGGFTRRHAATTRYRLTKTEQAFYDRMSDYVRTEWRKAMEKAAENAGESVRERNPRALLLTFYQKMMDSSLAAIRSALSGRVLALETALAKNKSELAKLSGAYSETFSMIREEMDEGEEESSLPESTREARENLAEVETELILTRKLYEESLAIKDNTKADTLRRLLDKIFSEKSDEKIVIFTQFKSTLADIQRIFPDRKIAVFHGSLSREEKDAAILDFKNQAQILVCTEAGGEGRNLQFARILINYDLPWNPFRIEQRIGRIHRFGQKYDVQIYNFAMEASIGERILEILSEKIKIFEDAFGETDALLGMVDGGGKTIEKLFMRLAMDSKSADPDKTARVIQEHLKASKEKMDKISGSLAISSQYLQEKTASPGDIKKEIRRLSLKLESFFLDYAKAFPEDFQILETKGEAGKRLFRIDSPGAPVEAEWVSFDYETAEGQGYIHLEHALVKRMLRKCLGQSLDHAVRVDGKDFQDPDREGAPRPNVFKSLEFSFVLSLDSIDREERSLTVSLDWDGSPASLPKLHAEARKKAQEILESEKKELHKVNSRLVESEMEKIERSSEKQIRELEEVLETYELRNKQSGGDNYFLLIPKVKKHLASLRREREAIEGLTREKREVRTDLYLFSLRAG